MVELERSSVSVRNDRRVFRSSRKVEDRIPLECADDFPKNHGETRISEVISEMYHPKCIIFPGYIYNPWERLLPRKHSTRRRVNNYPLGCTLLLCSSGYTETRPVIRDNFDISAKLY